jgi:prolyl oligopeptidase
MTDTARRPAYPQTPAGPTADDYHGHRIADPYRWLEDPDSAQTAAWIRAQNEVTEAWVSGVGAREQIRARLTELWDHPRTSAPYRRGERWFQLRNTGLQNQDVLFTMAAPGGDQGRVLLDPNGLSEDGTVALTVAEPSEDGSLLAYATSAAGSDWQTWRVLDIATGEHHDDVLEWSKFSGAAWTHDGAGFFYGAYDEPEQGAEYEQRNVAQRLQYHRLGTPQSDDRVVMAWPHDPEWSFYAEVSTDGRWLLVYVNRGTERRSRIWACPVDDFEPRPLIDEFDAAYEIVGSDRDTLFVKTDLDADRGRIVAVDLTDPRRETWREAVPESADTIESARVVGGRLVVLYLHDASHRIRLFDLDGTPAGEVDLGDLASITGLTGRGDDDAFCFVQVGFTRSGTVRRHEIATGRTETLVEPALALDGYETEQVFVTGKDGTRVPMFLVHKSGLAPSGDVPTLLWGYGGFDVSITPTCSVSWLAWLELGGLLAVANLRGGGEYGKEWYEAGRLDNKQNVFDDFIACAEWLIGTGWTRSERLAINGGSNGGLLVGACMTQRPDLYGACVPEVGVMDMLRYHKFTIGWAWTGDYGSPDDPHQFETLLAYSPLHNLRPGTAYPPTLVVTGDHDDRVVPGHSLKYLATLQAAQGDPDAPVLLRVEVSAGHGAGTPTSKLIAARTDVLSFLVGALQV